MNPTEPPHSRGLVSFRSGARIMSQLITRILLTVFLLPSAFLIYLITYLFADSYRGMNLRTGEAQILTGGVTWLFVAIYWILLWRKGVQWTQSRRLGTVIAIAGAIIVGIFVGGTVYTIEQSVGRFVGTIAAPLTWLIATVFI